MEPSDLLTIGHVTGVHGLKGYLKVRSYAASHDPFHPEARLFLGTPDGQGEWCTVVKASPHKKGMLVLLADVDVNVAETFVGRDIFIPEEALPDPEADTYYWKDLIGMTVIDIHEGKLGTIDHVIPTGSNDVFVVTGGKREVLVPHLAHVVLSVDVENRTMRIDLPEGL